MSKLGKVLIGAIEEVEVKGLITLQISPDVPRLRKNLKLFNPETLKKWEQRKRKPDSVSRAYLKCIEKAPKTIKKLVNS